MANDTTQHFNRRNHETIGQSPTVFDPRTLRQLRGIHVPAPDRMQEMRRLLRAPVCQFSASGLLKSDTREAAAVAGCRRRWAGDDGSEGRCVLTARREVVRQPHRQVGDSVSRQLGRGYALGLEERAEVAVHPPREARQPLVAPPVATLRAFGRAWYAANTSLKASQPNAHRIWTYMIRARNGSRCHSSESGSTLLGLEGRSFPDGPRPSRE